MVQYSKKNVYWLKKTRRTSEISDRERERDQNLKKEIFLMENWTIIFLGSENFLFLLFCKLINEILGSMNFTKLERIFPGFFDRL